MAYTAQDWSISALSVELGMDRRTLGKKIGSLEPVRVTGKTKYYRMADVVRQVFLAGGANDPAKEKSRLDRLRADKVELELSVARAELVRLDDMSRVIDKIILDSRQRLLIIPTKAAPIVMGCKTIPAVKAALQEAINEALYDLTQIDPRALLLGKRKTGVVGTTPRPNRKRVGRPRKKTKPGVKRRTRPVANQ